MGEVRLVDLEIIKRYSLAIRQETAPAADVLAALDATREMVAASLAEDDAAMAPAAPRRAARATKATKTTRAAKASKTTRAR